MFEFRSVSDTSARPSHHLRSCSKCLCAAGRAQRGRGGKTVVQSCSSRGSISYVRRAAGTPMCEIRLTGTGDSQEDQKRIGDTACSVWKGYWGLPLDRDSKAAMVNCFPWGISLSGLHGRLLIPHHYLLQSESRFRGPPCVSLSRPRRAIGKSTESTDATDEHYSSLKRRTFQSRALYFHNILYVIFIFIFLRKKKYSSYAL